MAFVTEDTTARTVALVLYHHYFYIFGTPLHLMMDNNLAFTSKVVQELCDQFGVKKVCTSAYHPQSNGAIKQQHQRVIKMIGKLSQDEKSNWPKHFPEIIQAYNGMRSTITRLHPTLSSVWVSPEIPDRCPFPYHTKEMHHMCC